MSVENLFIHGKGTRKGEFPQFSKKFFSRNGKKTRRGYKGWNDNVISICGFFKRRKKIGVDVKLTGTMKREHQDIATTRQPSPKIIYFTIGR